ncbi:hypothetical protein R1flu_022454 [Riccia fluitans]|uniref:Uncharacterized protein n=1 Tax=Riccia fluitans TaxID=41844 RepID=A0ABD1XP77_9MARC
MCKDKLLPLGSNIGIFKNSLPAFIDAVLGPVPASIAKWKVIIELWKQIWLSRNKLVYEGQGSDTIVWLCARLALDKCILKWWDDKHSDENNFALKTVLELIDHIIEGRFSSLHLKILQKQTATPGADSPARPTVAEEHANTDPSPETEQEDKEIFPVTASTSSLSDVQPTASPRPSQNNSSRRDKPNCLLGTPCKIQQKQGNTSMVYDTNRTVCPTYTSASPLEAQSKTGGLRNRPIDDTPKDLTGSEPHGIANSPIVHSSAPPPAIKLDAGWYSGLPQFDTIDNPSIVRISPPLKISSDGPTGAGLNETTMDTVRTKHITFSLHDTGQNPRKKNFSALLHEILREQRISLKAPQWTSTEAIKTTSISDLVHEADPGLIRIPPPKMGLESEDHSENPQQQEKSTEADSTGRVEKLSQEIQLQTGEISPRVDWITSKEIEIMRATPTLSSEPSRISKFERRTELDAGDTRSSPLAESSKRPFSTYKETRDEERRTRAIRNCQKTALGNYTDADDTRLFADLQPDAGPVAGINRPTTSVVSPPRPITKNLIKARIPEGVSSALHQTC